MSHFSFYWLFDILRTDSSFIFLISLHPLKSLKFHLFLCMLYQSVNVDHVLSEPLQPPVQLVVSVKSSGESGATNQSKE